MGAAESKPYQYYTTDAIGLCFNCGGPAYYHYSIQVFYGFEVCNACRKNKVIMDAKFEGWKCIPLFNTSS